MPTPIPIESFTTKENKVDLYDAAHINTLQTSIVTLETALNKLLNTDGSLAQGTSFPASPVTGQLFYRNDLGQLYIYSGSAWAPIAPTTAIQIFTSSGTFTAPTGITKVYLTMVAGGGGGGGANSSVPGGGGGAGASVLNYAYTVVPGNNYTVTVGAGGSGGNGLSGTNGSSGGSTQFAGVVTVSGGGGGVSSTTNNNGGTGAGGFDASASITTVATVGGGYSIKGGNGAKGGTAGNQAGGGGGSPLGVGGSGGTSGNDGQAGASGAGGGGGGAGNNGGAGGGGICIVAY